MLIRSQGNTAYERSTLKMNKEKSCRDNSRERLQDEARWTSMRLNSRLEPTEWLSTCFWTLKAKGGCSLSPNLHYQRWKTTNDLWPSEWSSVTGWRYLLTLTYSDTWQLTRVNPLILCIKLRTLLLNSLWCMFHPDIHPLHHSSSSYQSCLLSITLICNY